MDTLLCLPSRVKAAEPWSAGVQPERACLQNWIGLVKAVKPTVDAPQNSGRADDHQHERTGKGKESSGKPATNPPSLPDEEPSSL
eukprot:CAMPEP_0202372312 /NCGR_PEP_ID=MMETSP1127-20130417/3531_1 /ASSEMBLY_ACC=CAM_ASM_000462 /TAXON_ID=3047 /ORGANISM="Dunaliella tertiolecta, Strain CCMP1320" /LENGTH=84 /DNA_ID=CAMNT_0048968811 /DNA_START=461 /DNA_END=713 /DNA_ORIENTATION=-